MNELPKGWAATKWNDITAVDGFRRGPFGGNLKKSCFVDEGYAVYEQYAPINNDCRTFRYFVTKDKFNELASFQVNNGDFLISCSGTMGRITCVPEGAPLGVINQALLRIRLQQGYIYPEYFLWLFKSPMIQSLVLNKSVGGAIQNLAAVKELKEIPLPLAPLPEQKRIVEKLDEVLAQVDTIKARLDGIPDLLKRFRQSVLASAVSGKLTEEWRVDNSQQVSLSDIEDAFVSGWESEKRKDFLAKGKTPKNESWKAKCPTPYLPTDNESEFVGDLPATWLLTSVDQLTKFVKDGPHYSPKYVDDGIEFISGRNITIKGIDFSSSKYISQELHEELSVRCKPEFNDVLLTKGGTTGVSCVNKHTHEFNVWVHVAVLRVTSEEIIMPEYLSLFFNSSIGYAQSQNYTHGVANRDLGLKRMVKICLGLPSLSEQTEIVRLADQYLALADTIEAQVTKAQARVDKLTQTILAKAFRGELVPQDENDEPADKLLERIAQARAEAEALAKAAKKAEAAKKRAAKA
ncbi:restriction endonuclease subunit S [Vibrio sp. 1S139]|uniref:restriction endonuclease subunit S n=1 Tax=Vibrio sp. 1S139 TaxID=3230006 RepID=UPI00352D80CC